MTRTVTQLFDLHGKTALVTGGSRGLGLQLAHALGEAGARLMLSSRKQADLDEAVAELKAAGLNATALAADCANEADIHRLGAEALKQLGQWIFWSTTPVPVGAHPPKTTPWKPGTR